jgi:sulfatase maturation enzyme AslB (radical SAM superfamily)
MLKFANSFFQKRNITPVFDIQTNASEIDTKFAYDLKNNGINIALVSFHTIDKDIFNSMI